MDAFKGIHGYIMLYTWVILVDLHESIGSLRNSFSSANGSYVANRSIKIPKHRSYVANILASGIWIHRRTSFCMAIIHPDTRMTYYDISRSLRVNISCIQCMNNMRISYIHIYNKSFRIGKTKLKHQPPTEYMFSVRKNI